MKFIRKLEVARRVGWHPVHLMRKANGIDFPRPVKIGPNSIGFVEEEVESWMKARIAARDSQSGEPA